MTMLKRLSFLPLMQLLLIAFITISCIQCTSAWTQHLTKQGPKNYSSSARSKETTNRRGFLCTNILTFTGISLVQPNDLKVANAIETSSSSTQVKIDKENVIKGYKRLNYLLSNWEKETTVCGRTDNPYIGCERTPEKVMDYLGFKSMNDPLFRIDKTLSRLQNLVAGTDDEIDFMEAMDVINQAVEDGNGIAFVSSWGEANPGGGKDRIELFIERSKRYVLTTRDGLATIIKILNLKVE